MNNSKEEKLLKNLKQAKRLNKYSFPTNKNSFPPSFDFSRWNKMRIAVIGSKGSGKSSFIGTLERTLRDNKNFTLPPHCVPQNSRGEGTLILQEFQSTSCWSLLDTRGFTDYSQSEMKELINILDGKIKPGEFVYRDQDEDLVGDLVGELGEISFKNRSKAPLHECVTSVIFVLNPNDFSHNRRDNNMNEKLAEMRNYFRFKGMSVITVVTHSKENYSSNILFDRYTASAATGSPIELVFPISNYRMGYGSKRVPKIEKAVMKALEAALASSENFIRIQSQLDYIKNNNNN